MPSRDYGRLIRYPHKFAALILAWSGTAAGESKDGSIWERFEVVETSIETNFEKLDNRDLDDTTADGLSVLRPELKVEIAYRASKRIQAFTELELESRLVVSRGRDRSRESNRTELNVKQLYVDFDDVAEGLSFRVGRQEFEDRREWLYDEDLDGVRVFDRRDRLSLELSASRERIFTEDLIDDDRPEDRINNYILYGSYRLNEGHRINAYTLRRDDLSNGSENPIFYGLSADDTVADTMDYWLELASVRGRDGSERLRGYGFDVGGTYRLEAPWQAALTLSHAFGSGDSDSDDNVDRRFRQTGLEDNSYRYNGVENFRYYGETLNPELSNLSILTAGFGIRPSRRSSVDLVYHRYHQDVVSSGRIPGARIRASANGDSRDVGEAVDLILGYHDIPGLRLRAKLGYFMPGKAFGDTADDAYSVELGVECKFWPDVSSLHEQKRLLAFVLGKPVRDDSVFPEMFEYLRGNGVAVQVHLPHETGDLVPAGLSDVTLIVNRGLQPVALNALADLERAGISCCNRIDATFATQHRGRLLRRLAEAGLPVPRWSRVDAWSEVLLRAAQQAIVVKALDGRLGQGVGVTFLRSAEHSPVAPFPGPYIVQDRIPSDGRDRKVYVAGTACRGLIKSWPRCDPQDREPFVPGSVLSECALAVGRVLKLNIYGVDFLEAAAGPVIVDVNVFPGFKGVPAAAELIGEYLYRRWLSGSS
jgi:alginate production protein